MSGKVIDFNPKGRTLTPVEILQRVVKSPNFGWQRDMIYEVAVESSKKVNWHTIGPMCKPLHDGAYLADHPANVGFLFAMLWAANGDGGCFDITPLQEGLAVTMFGGQDVDMAGRSLCVTLAAILLYLTNPKGLHKPLTNL